MTTPKPVPERVVCSVCGLDWKLHGTYVGNAKPKLEKCIELLKAELAKRPKWPPTSFYGNTVGPVTYSSQVTN